MFQISVLLVRKLFFVCFCCWKSVLPTFFYFFCFRLGLSFWKSFVASVSFLGCKPPECRRDLELTWGISRIMNADISLPCGALFIRFQLLPDPHLWNLAMRKCSGNPLASWWLKPVLPCHEDPNPAMYMVRSWIRNWLFWVLMSSIMFLKHMHIFYLTIQSLKPCTLVFPYWISLAPKHSQGQSQIDCCTRVCYLRLVQLKDVEMLR